MRTMILMKHTIQFCVCIFIDVWFLLDKKGGILKIADFVLGIISNTSEYFYEFIHSLWSSPVSIRFPKWDKTYL